MLDDLKIRNKLILLVVGPLVVVVLLAALGARGRLASADDSAKVETLVAVAKADSDVVDAVQQEALYSTASVGSAHRTWLKELTTARSNTDTVLKVGLERLNGNIPGATPGLRSAKALAVDAADKLTYIRRAVDQGYTWDQAAETYSSLQDTFLSVNTAVASSLSDPQAAGDLRTAAALASYKSAIAGEGTLLAGSAQAGGFGSATRFSLLQSAVATERSDKAILDSVADNRTTGAARDLLADSALPDLRDRTVAAGADAKPVAKADAVTRETGLLIKGLHGVEVGLFDNLSARAGATHSSAQRSANLFLIAAALAVFGAAAAALILGRRITRPLRKLTVAAEHLSTEQMPRLIETLKNPSIDEDLGFQLSSLRPIEITSSDEIGQLAVAFNEVQRVAGEVATEQAALLRKGIGEMFVNLARRNQALLDRQIDFIDELERGEEDPDALDNLYKLDHLATRMRRNAESLLVLAGSEPPRRRGRPAPLGNVVRAALAEVEDFGRIDLLSFDEVMVASNAAADLAHLLSELMENATNFSPPETRIEVVGHRTKADGYVISVTDHGIGMSTSQITSANESLAKPPLVGLAMTRSLGFIVVGRLAARHGIAVRMMTSASGGVTAVVSLAPSLVVDAPEGSSMIPPSPEAPARLKPVLAQANATMSELASRDAERADSSGDAAPAPVTFLTPVAPTVPTSLAPADEPLDVPAANLKVDSHPPLTPSSGDGPLAWTPSAPEAPTPLTARTPMTAPPEPAAGEAMPEPLPATPPATVPTIAGGPAPFPPLPEPQGARPFFLLDQQPLRRAAADVGVASPVEPAVTGPKPARLFGGPSPETASGLPSRRVSRAAGQDEEAPEARAEAESETVVTEPTPDAASVTADPVPEAAPASPLPTRTATGLAKRTPRGTSGAQRSIPGADGERGVNATKRSPEEIRAMLSRHSEGRQRARSQEPVPAGAPEREGTS